MTATKTSARPAVYLSAQALSRRSNAERSLVDGRWWSNGELALLVFAEAQSPAWAHQIGSAWEWDDWKGGVVRLADWMLKADHQPAALVPDDCPGEDGRMFFVFLGADGSRESTQPEYARLAWEVAAPDRWTFAPIRGEQPGKGEHHTICGWRGDELVVLLMPLRWA